jgi:hypothetical protein
MSITSSHLTIIFFPLYKNFKQRTVSTITLLHVTSSFLISYIKIYTGQWPALYNKSSVTSQKLGNKNTLNGNYVDLRDRTRSLIH